MSETFLTPEEVKILTGRGIKSLQIEQLRKIGATILGECEQRADRAEVGD